MTKKLYLCVLLIFFSCLTALAARSLWRGETMKSEKVCQKWGSTEFDVNKFKTGNENLRASMSCSLLKKESDYIGKDRSEIRQLFGDHDGFYFSDMFPAYMIQSGQNSSEDSWQVVFLLDRNEKVSDIIVHKNCCNR